MRRGFASRKSDLTHLQRAILVQKNVGWFQVTMNHRERVYELDSNEHLIEESLDVLSRQVLG